MRKSVLLLAATLIVLTLGSCVSTHSTIASSAPQIQLKPEHLDITEQKEGTAVTTRIFGIDWARLFSSRSATIRGTVVGSLVSFDRTDDYAVYSLLKQNEGYDMVLYPKFNKTVRKPFLGIGAICTVTEVKVTARMAKLKF